MSRWIGSLLIATVSSLVTLLLASSAQPPQSTAAKPGASAANPADDIVQQLAMFDLADQAEQVNPSHAGPVDPPRERINHSGTSNVESVNKPAGSGMRLRPEFIDRCMEVARDIDSALAARIEASRQKDAAEFERNMRQAGRRLFALAELKQHDPDLYGAKLNELRMELAVRQKARELCEARSSGNTLESGSLEKELRGMLATQLGLSIKARGDLVCRLQEQINAIRSDIDHQASAFDETVAMRLQALITQPQCDATEELNATLNNAAVPMTAPVSKPN